MRHLAQELRAHALDTGDAFYRRWFQSAAAELEAEAEQLERADWLRQKSSGLF